MSNSKTAKRLTGGIIAIIVLSICLCITTFALVWATLSVDNNLFHTGIVDINLNDGKPVIYENQLSFSPGMTVKRDFFIENNSTWSVYYKLYFSNVTGGLADVLQVTIKDGEKVLYTGTTKELSREKVSAADDVLQVGEKRTLTAYFTFPSGTGHKAYNRNLSFTVSADAVQTKNNPNKLFD